MSVLQKPVAYTSEALVSDCVGRYITTSTGNVQLANLINTKTYMSCWQAFIFWIASQYQSSGSANLSPVGILTFTKRNDASQKVKGILHSTAPNAVSVPKFSFFHSFLDQYNLAILPNQEAVGVVNSQDVSAQRMNLLSLSKLAGCETQTFRTALSHLTRRVGEVLACGEPVYLDLGVGALKGDKNTVTFEFFEAPAPAASAAAAGMSGAPRPAAAALRSQYPLGSSRHRKPLPSSLTPLPPPQPEPAHTTPAFPTAAPAYRRKLTAAAPLATARAIASAHAQGQTHVPMLPPPPQLPALAAPPAPQRQPVGPDASDQGVDAAAGFSVSRVLEHAQALAEQQQQPAQQQPFSAARRVPASSLRPALDLFARTRAATFLSSTAYRPPSTRIAAHYSPRAAPYVLADSGVVAARPDPADEPPAAAEAGEDQVLLSRLWAELDLPSALPPAPLPLDALPRLAAHAHALKCGMGNALDLAHFHKHTQAPLHSLSPHMALLAAPSLAPLHRQLLHASVTRSAARYLHYTAAGIPSAVIAPLNPAWLRAALSILSGSVPASSLAPLPPAATTALLSALVAEVTRDYLTAVKRAILDYILLAPQHRARMGIPLPPPPASHAALWGSGLAPPAAPLSWHPRIQHSFLALAASLHTVGPLCIALLRVNAKYQDLLLFDVPAAAELPLSVAELEARQRKHVSRAHKILATQWLEDCEREVRAHVSREGISDGSSAGLFEAVGTLMAVHLRAIVQRSAAACHAFFMQFATAPLQCAGGWIPMGAPPATHTDDMQAIQRHAAAYAVAREEASRRCEANMPQPALLQRLEVRRVRERSLVVLDMSHAEMHKTLVALFDRLCESVRGMSRVEGKIFPLHTHSRGSELGVWVQGELGTAAVQALKQAVGQVVELSARECQSLALSYEQYERLLDGEHELEAWLSQPRDEAELRARVTHYLERAREVSAAPRTVRCGMVAVDCAQANAAIAHKAQALATKVCEHVVSRILRDCARLGEEFKALRTVLLRRPSSAKDLHALLAALSTLMHSQHAELVAQSVAQRELLLFLLDPALQFRLPGEASQAVAEVWRWTKQLKALAHECESVCEGERVRLERVLRERRVSVLRALEQVRLQCDQLRDMCEPKRATEYLGKVAAVQQSLERVRTEGDAINEQERLLALQLSEFVQLDECVEVVAPYAELWSLFARWQAQEQQWMHSYVFDLDPAQVQAEARAMLDSATRVVGLLAHTRAEQRQRRDVSALGVAEALRDDMAAFKPHVALVLVLCDPLLQERHFDRVCAVLGSSVRPDHGAGHHAITLHKLVEMDVGAHAAELAEIAACAREEGAVLALVDDMKAEWTDLALRVRPHGDGGALFDEKSVAEAAELLEQQIQRLDTVKDTEPARVHAGEVAQWGQWLHSSAEALRSLLHVQAHWEQLEPLFAELEPAMALHTEAVRFAQADSQWRALLRDACVDLRVRSLAALPHLGSLLATLLADLTACADALEQFQQPT